ncbi:immune inhibitor A [Vibrio sp. SCSIO 43132]|uniref:immune inhibitor A domain-containing protein n=1 Tax=Vibrio sp. SCSIO 43132 TaxID=2779363 RepID=UPI001CA7EEEB|nr:immune inhibitor A domain-containing protein [Vibrio sp. SCSIO 43132]UAB73117.1 immune inhibitor A [Vibrio sp. SCSIO 43132]
MANFKHTVLLASSLAIFSGISYAHAPADMGVVNEERIANMLIRSGKLSKDATQSEKEAAVHAYLKNKNNYGLNGNAQFGKKAIEKRNKILKSLAQKKGQKLDASALGSRSVIVKRTDRVIALMIDFPDLPWDDNGITAEHTDMLYDSYPTSHYADLLFAPSGYEGPNGENLTSMRQFYEQESGGSYSVAGDGFGWYRAANNAAYYGGNSADSGNDLNPRELVREALNQLAIDPSVNLADYDIEDRYDYDNDGNYREPDGLIDHLMIFHSSVGEEAGGGAIGEDAIWSHRWDLGSVHLLPGTTSSLPDRFNGQYAAFDYTIQPIDAAVGVAAHEYAHDLGLPDEYDTRGTGNGEPVAYWSMMSSGSWAGSLAGTQPTAFSSYAKEFLQESLGGNWINSTQLSLADLSQPRYLSLFETTDNLRPNMVRIDLSAKKVDNTSPFEGKFAFYSQKGDDLNNSMSRKIRVPEGSSVSLKFKAWYEIEKDYDFARVLVNGTQIPGNITTMQDPYNTGLVPAITGESGGWVDAVFNVSEWAGADITLTFDYVTDGGLAMEGLYIDNIVFDADGVIENVDDAEGDESSFRFNGFERNAGYHFADHYYLLQWRSYDGVDQGLANIRRSGQLISYDPGLIVWYVDNSFTDNWVGLHPGEGWLGVVDADQTPFIWSNGDVAISRYQVRDAAFSLENNSPLVLVDDQGNLLQDTNLTPVSLFDDSIDYSSPTAPHSGRKLAEVGLSIEVIHQAQDNSYGVVQISYQKPNEAPSAAFTLEVNGMSVTATNSSSDPDGEIASYLWDFGNGQTSTDVNPTWQYVEAGEYTVSLTVTDNDGATASYSEQVEIVTDVNEAPVAQGDYFPLFGRFVLLYSTSYDPDGHIVKTRWKLGKNRVRFGSVIFTRLPANKKAVRLTVTDNEGAKDSTKIRLD